MARPHRMGALCNDDCFLSVCLSVCTMPDPKGKNGMHSKLKICRREAYDTIIMSTL